MPTTLEKPAVKPVVAITEVRTLTIREAAELAGLERTVLDAAVRAGSLRIMRLPGVRRVLRTELDRWLESLVTPLESL